MFLFEYVPKANASFLIIFLAFPIVLAKIAFLYSLLLYQSSINNYPFLLVFAVYILYISFYSFALLIYLKTPFTKYISASRDLSLVSTL